MTYAEMDLHYICNYWVIYIMIQIIVITLIAYVWNVYHPAWDITYNYSSPKM